MMETADNMIPPIFNMYKVKFSKMDELKVRDHNKKSCRIFINLEMPLRTLFTDHNNNYLIAMGNSVDVNLSIVSSMINLAQHYRLYFAKYGVNAKAYLYFNYPSGYYKNFDYIIEYRNHYTSKILKNLNCQYLEDHLNSSITFLNKFIKYSLYSF